MMKANLLYFAEIESRLWLWFDPRVPEVLLCLYSATLLENRPKSNVINCAEPLVTAISTPSYFFLAAERPSFFLLLLSVIRNI